MTKGRTYYRWQLPDGSWRGCYEGELPLDFAVKPSKPAWSKLIEGPPPEERESASRSDGTERPLCKDYAEHFERVRSSLALPALVPPDSCIHMFGLTDSEKAVLVEALTLHIEREELRANELAVCAADLKDTPAPFNRYDAALAEKRAIERKQIVEALLARVNTP